MELLTFNNATLRSAVRANLVSFPAQAPTDPRASRPDIEWRVAVLYFVRGWCLREVARKYGVTRERAGQLASQWRKRSIRQGYIQEIPPETRC